MATREPEKNNATWQANQLRLTMFPVLPTTGTASDWWADTVGEPPETAVQRPKIGGYRLEGPYELGRLSLEVAPGRVDWYYNAASGSQPDERPLTPTGLPPEVEELPTIGPVAEALTSFLGSMRKWLARAACPDAQRFALGAILLDPVATRKEGHLRLARLLPGIAIDADHSRDFLYQINRPRPTKTGIAGLSINRLAKWSVIEFQSSLLALEPAIPTPAVTQGPESFACRLEVDFNTDRYFSGALVPAQLRSLLDELSQLLLELAAAGDIP
jgi:hypothetical protein